MTNKTGIVSISFRKYSVTDILKVAREAGLDSVEWGGDVHVPHGDEGIARETAELTDACGLSVAEYGSYYVIGQSEPELFEKAAVSARALGTDIIRVWPGMNRSSDSINDGEYEKYVADAKRICDAAPDLTVALECHPNSLTDEYHTAIKFIEDVGRVNLKMFWQPNQYRPECYNLDAIRALLPYIVSVHVFSWSRKTRLPLEAGADSWKKYISLLKSKNLSYMLEFMHDDRLETLQDTAKTLKEWLSL